MILALLGLLPAIPHIIIGVEQIFGHGRGLAKKQAATNTIADLLNLSVAANNPLGTLGTLGTGIPASSDSDMMKYIDALIESTVTYLNAKGVMKHSPTTTLPS